MFIYFYLTFVLEHGSSSLSFFIFLARTSASLQLIIFVHIASCNSSISSRIVVVVLVVLLVVVVVVVE